MAVGKVAPLLSLLLFCACSAQRETINFDLDWAFKRGKSSAYNISTNCTASDFPIAVTGKQCLGLHAYGGARTADECRDACCSAYSGCEVSGQ